MKNFFLTLSLFFISFYAMAVPTVITGSVSVNSSGIYNADGYIITPGAELYMTGGAFYFNPGMGIEVLSHGYLQLIGPNVTLKCASGSSYWKGITIYGDGTPYNPSDPIPANWGMQTEGNFIIATAEIGIHMRHEKADYISGAVTIVGNGYARSIRSYTNSTCEFVDNRLYDIRITNNVITRNYSATNGGTPTVWSNYKFSSNSPSYVMAMELVNTNLVTEVREFRISSPALGIYLNNSNANLNTCEIFTNQLGGAAVVHQISTNNLTSTSVQNSTIDAHKYGIYSRGSEYLYIYNNEIRSVYYCMYYKYTLGSKVVNNQIKGSQIGMEFYQCKIARVDANICSEHTSKDIYLFESYDSRLSSNRIGWGTVYLSNEGIHVQDSENTRIIRNQFKKSKRSIYFSGLNPIVKIHCNTFYDPSATIDAAIRVDNNPIDDQGSLGDGGANNYFNALPSSTIRVRNTVSTPLTFTNSSAIAGNNPSVNTIFNINPLFNANCSVPKIAQDAAEVESTKITPVPNPFTDIVTIGERTKAIQIFSISGQHIQTINTEGVEVNLGHLESGTYFMVTEDMSGNTSRHKLIKQ